MTSARQMYQLQELDQEITRVEESLSSVEQQLGDRSEIDSMEKELSEVQARLGDFSTDQPTREGDVSDASSKLEATRQKLYSGAVTNVRELEAMEKEATSQEIELQKREESLLETMESIEEAQATVNRLKADVSRGQREWKSRQSELSGQQKELSKTIQDLKGQRNGSAKGLPPQALTLYERLRVSKAGIAVARVERGLCRGCLMALPTHQIQRARTAPEPVQCNSCGRILYVG